MDYNNNALVKLAPFTDNEIAAATNVLASGLTDTLSINERFETNFARYMGVKFVLACCNGTAAMLEAMWACGVGQGTSVIAPAMTYWASVYPAYSLGAKVSYVDIDRETLGIDPAKLESSITENTKAIIVVHLYGHPCNMDDIMLIARKYQLRVIEDFSHAHGGKYKGSRCGSIGDIGVASCMGEKPFSLPEGGVLCTDDRELYERCCTFGHYRYLGCVENGEKKIGKVENDVLLSFLGAPVGGIKNRMNPVSAAIGIERLKTFDSQIIETNKAVRYFMDLVEEGGGFMGHRVCESDGSNMGGWYEPKLFVRGKRARNVVQRLHQMGYQRSYAGHKYFNLANHLITTRDFFREHFNSEQILSMRTALNYRRFETLERTDEQLLSAPRFSGYREAIIEEYGFLYKKAWESVF